MTAVLRTSASKWHRSSWYSAIARPPTCRPCGTVSMADPPRWPVAESKRCASMGTFADRQTFREVLAGLAAKTLTKIPALNGRVEKACKLVLGGDVALHPDGTALVGSLTDPSRAYLVVKGACDCQDFAHAPEHLCAHRLAVGFS